MDFEFTEEQRMFRDAVRDFVAKEVTPRASEWDETEEFPSATVKKMAEVGMFSAGLPENIGGNGDLLSNTIAIEEISYGSSGLGVIYLVSTGLAIYPILMHGNEGQKKKYLTRTVNGAISAFALTEAIGGSDVAILQTRYTQNGDYFILNGNKLFITNGAEAEFITTFATKDPSLGYRGISAFIVDKDTPGFSVGKLERKMGMHPSSTAELIFDNCKIPIGNLLAAEGKGFRIALEAIDESRVAIATQALGNAKAAYDAAVEYAKEREAFGKKIAQHQAIQWMLADMAVDVETSKLLIYEAAWLTQKMGKSPLKEAAMAKVYASEAAHRVCHKAIQIFGGYGYTKDFPVERYYRDQRLLEIYEGTSEMQRWTIAREITGLK